MISIVPANVRRGTMRALLLAIGLSMFSGFAALSAASRAHAQSMSFTILTAAGVEGCPNRCRSVILAQGEIDNAAGDRFERIVRERFGAKPNGLTVLLESTGGYVIAAARLGHMFRKYRAIVAVAGAASIDRNSLRVTLRAAKCTSACVYALMGGVRRVLPAGSSIILHRSFASRGWFRAPEHDNDVLQQYILGYARSMGVSEEAVAFAEQLPASELYVARPDQIAGWRLAAPAF